MIRDQGIRDAIASLVRARYRTRLGPAEARAPIGPRLGVAEMPEWEALAELLGPGIEHGLVYGSGVSLSAFWLAYYAGAGDARPPSGSVFDHLYGASTLSGSCGAGSLALFEEPTPADRAAPLARANTRPRVYDPAQYDGLLVLLMQSHEDPRLIQPPTGDGWPDLANYFYQTGPGVGHTAYFLVRDVTPARLAYWLVCAGSSYGIQATRLAVGEPAACDALWLLAQLSASTPIDADAMTRLEAWVLRSLYRPLEGAEDVVLLSAADYGEAVIGSPLAYGWHGSRQRWGTASERLTGARMCTQQTVEIVVEGQGTLRHLRSRVYEIAVAFDSAGDPSATLSLIEGPDDWQPQHTAGALCVPGQTGLEPLLTPGGTPEGDWTQPAAAYVCCSDAGWDALMWLGSEEHSSGWSQSWTELAASKSLCPGDTWSDQAGGSASGMVRLGWSFGGHRVSDPILSGSGSWASWSISAGIGEPAMWSRSSQLGIPNNSPPVPPVDPGGWGGDGSSAVGRSATTEFNAWAAGICGGYINLPGNVACCRSSPLRTVSQASVASVVDSHTGGRGAAILGPSVVALIATDRMGAGSAAGSTAGTYQADPPEAATWQALRNATNPALIQFAGEVFESPNYRVWYSTAWQRANGVLKPTMPTPETEAEGVERAEVTLVWPGGSQSWDVSDRVDTWEAYARVNAADSPLTRNWLYAAASYGGAVLAYLPLSEGTGYEGWVSGGYTLTDWSPWSGSWRGAA